MASTKNGLKMKSSISEKDFDEFNNLFESSIDSTIETDALDGKINTETLPTVIEETLIKNDKRNEFLSNSNEIKQFDDMTLEEKLNQIHDEFMEDVTLTMANIKDIAFREAAIKGRWASRLVSEKLKQKQLKERYVELSEKISHMVHANLPKSASCIENMKNSKIVMENDSNLKELQRQIEESKIVIELISSFNESVKGLGFTVRNSIAAINLEMGM